MPSERLLSKRGYRMRQAIAEAGVETTPQELADAVDEARERVRPGPDGVCVKCGREPGYGVDFRYGLCDFCAFPDKKGASHE